MAHHVCLGAREIPVEGALLLACDGAPLSPRQLRALAAAAVHEDDKMALDLLCSARSVLEVTAVATGLSTMRMLVLLPCTQLPCVEFLGLNYIAQWLKDAGGAMLSLAHVPAALCTPSFADACRALVFRESEPFSLQAPHTHVPTPSCSMHIQSDRLRCGAVRDRRGGALVGQHRSGKTFAACCLLVSVPLRTVIVARDESQLAYWRAILARSSVKDARVVTATHAAACVRAHRAQRLVLDCELSLAMADVARVCERVLVLLTSATTPGARAALDLPAGEHLPNYCVELPAPRSPPSATVRALLVPSDDDDLVTRALDFVPRSERAQLLCRGSDKIWLAVRRELPPPAPDGTPQPDTDCICAVCRDAPAVPVRCAHCHNSCCHPCVHSLRRCPLCRCTPCEWETIEHGGRMWGEYAAAKSGGYTLRHIQRVSTTLHAWHTNAKPRAVVHELQLLRAASTAPHCAVIVSALYGTLCAIASALTQECITYKWHTSLTDSRAHVTLMPMTAISPHFYTACVDTCFVLEPHAVSESLLQQCAPAREYVYVAHHAQL